MPACEPPDGIDAGRSPPEPSRNTRNVFLQPPVGGLGRRIRVSPNWFGEGGEGSCPPRVSNCPGGQRTFCACAQPGHRAVRIGGRGPVPRPRHTASTVTTVTGVEVGFVLLTERNALPAFVEELTRGERYRPLGRVSSIAGAVEIARSRAADVVVVDVVSAERLNRVVAFVRDMAPAKVVLVSGLPPEAALLTAMTAGVRGFLRKPVPAGLLAQAVDAVVAGQTFVDPRSTQWLVELALHGHRSRPWSGLTFRQSQVV